VEMLKIIGAIFIAQYIKEDHFYAHNILKCIVGFSEKDNITDGGNLSNVNKEEQILVKNLYKEILLQTYQEKMHTDNPLCLHYTSLRKTGPAEIRQTKNLISAGLLISA